MHPSSMPSILPSFKPSVLPSHKPTSEPTLKPSPQPSISPSYPLRSKTFYYLEMTLEGMNHLLHTSIDQDFWRDVTSNHVMEFNQEMLTKFDEDIQVIHVKTNIIRQYGLYSNRGDNRELRGSRNSKIKQPPRLLHQKNDQFAQIRIMYNQEFLYRGNEDTVIPQTIVTDPFRVPDSRDRYVQHLKDGLDGGRPTDSFAYLFNAIVEYLRSETPSLSPSNKPSVKPSAQPSIQLRRQRNDVGTIVVPVLISLIILMVAATAWFCFVHKTAGSDVTLGRHLYSALSQRQWKNQEGRPLNLRSRNQADPISNETNATGVSFGFPIRGQHDHMSDDLSMSMISDPVVTMSQLLESPIRSHVRGQEREMKRIRERDLDDSEIEPEANVVNSPPAPRNERKRIITLPDAPLTPPLKPDGSRNEDQGDASPTLGRTTVLTGTGDFSHIHMLKVSEIDDLTFSK